MASLDLPDIPIGSYEQYAADQFRALTQPVLDRLQMAPNPAIEAIRNQVDPSNRIFVDQAVGAAQRAGIDPVTYIRQINAESGFNPNAGSNEGAKGIAQFTDATAKGYGIDPYNPGQALDAGARYMATALATNHGDYRLALASYNAGQGNVDRYGQNIFNPAYLKAQGWSDEDANQPAHYIASILGGGATPTTTPTPASLVQGAGAALGAAAGQVAQVPQQAVQSFKDYSAGLLHQFSQSLAPPAPQQPSYNAMAGADSSRPSDLPTPPDAPQTPDLGGSSFHDWSNNLIGQLAQTSSVPPAVLSSPGAAVAGAAGGDAAMPSPALSSPTPGYNDMVGASSTPQPPAMPTPATGGTPPSTPAPSFADWSTNLINQLGQRLGVGDTAPTAGPSATPSGGPSYNDMVGARSNGQGGAVPSLTSLDNAPPGIQAPGTPGLPLLPGPHPLADAVGNVRDAALNQYNTNVANLESATTPRPVGTRPSLADLQRGTDVVAPLVLGTLGGDVPSTGGDVTRMYHGTGSAFTTPDGAKFDPGGLFGPGYYLTSDARVASSYAMERSPHPQTTGYFEADGTRLAANEAELRQNIAQAHTIINSPSFDSYTKAYAQERLPIYEEALASGPGKLGGGPNLRAVNVPNGLNLLNADAPISLQDARPISAAITNPDVKAHFDRWTFPNDEQTAVNPGATGSDTWARLVAAQDQGIGEQTPALVANRTMQQAGYDGIKYNGGQRVPMTDDAGQPIQHQAVVIFPESLPKLTNAISGTPMGSPPAVGGAVLGGVYGATQGDTPQERAKNAALGALGGGLAGHVLGGGRLPVGMSVEDASAIGKAPPTVSDALTAPPSNPPPTGGSTASPAEPLNNRAGNILLTKFSPDVQQVIADAAAKDPQAMEAARRGVVSDATVQQLADAAGTTVQKVIDRWKPGDAANAETINAMRGALAAKSNEITTLNKAIAGGDSSPAALAQFNLAVREQQAIQQSVAGVTAEAGRGLRALRASVTSAVQSGDASQMQAVLTKMGGTEWTQELSDKLAHLDPTDATARYQFLRNALKPSLASDLMGLWYNSLLSSPHTFLVKTTSEAVSLALSPLERGFAAAVDLPLSALSGRPRARFFGEIKPDLVGMVGGFTEGVPKALYMMQHGFSLSDAMAGSDFTHANVFGQSPVVSSVVNFPSRLLQAGVEMFGSVAQAGALNAGAYRLARLEGNTGQALVDRMAELRQNPTPALLQYAKDQGAYRVYQQKPGDMMQKFLAFRNTEYHQIPVMRIVIPFAQTPANLLKFGLERSPLGAFNFDMWKNIAAKNPEAADNIGRWLMGSAISTAIALQFGAGNITGLAPTSTGQRLAWEREGTQPNSIRIGDKWVNFAKIPVLGDTLLQVATLMKDINAGKDVGGTAGDLALTIGSNLSQQPYLQGVAGLMNALRSPTQYGDQFINSLGASVVPSLVRVAAQTLDPVRRDTQGVGQAIQAEIPGWSQQLPAKLGAFGEERQRESSLISPSPITDVHVSPVDAELTKYGVEPGLSGKTLRGINLTHQEQTDLQRVSGQVVKESLDRLVANPRYGQLNDVQKARALNLAITRAKDVGARQYVAQLLQTQGRDVVLRRIQDAKAQRLPAAG